jgi:putative effector of murein hydrolase LrgA (UPF0299 family)
LGKPGSSVPCWNIDFFLWPYSCVVHMETVGAKQGVPILLVCKISLLSGWSALQWIFQIFWQKKSQRVTFHFGRHI